MRKRILETQGVKSILSFNTTVDTTTRRVMFSAEIDTLYLTVKAAGVWAGGIETPSVETPSEGSKFFGFDMDNEFISGFDVGAWGVLL
ncbi:replication protein P [Escherichia coli]|nr:replication protein P [Escherichia coli]